MLVFVAGLTGFLLGGAEVAAASAVLARVAVDLRRYVRTLP